MNCFLGVMTSQPDCLSDISANLPPLDAALFDSTEARAKVFNALADPTRLKIVEVLLAEKELSSTQIANQLDISLALLCHHSKILMEAGILQLRKQGQTKFRSVNRELLQACFTSLDRLGD